MPFYPSGHARYARYDEIKSVKICGMRGRGTAREPNHPSYILDIFHRFASYGARASLRKCFDQRHADWLRGADQSLFSRESSAQKGYDRAAYDRVVYRGGGGISVSSNRTSCAGHRADDCFKRNADVGN